MIRQQQCYSPEGYLGQQQGQQGRKVSFRQVVSMIEEIERYKGYCGCIAKATRLDEEPAYIKHACLVCGLVALPMQDMGYDLYVRYYFCTACGALYVYYED